MTDVVNPKSSSPDQLLPYHKKISAEDKALMVYFISYTYMVLNSNKDHNTVYKTTRNRIHRFTVIVSIF